MLHSLPLVGEEGDEGVVEVVEVFGVHGVEVHALVVHGVLGDAAFVVDLDAAWVNPVHRFRVERDLAAVAVRCEGLRGEVFEGVEVLRVWAVQEVVLSSHVVVPYALAVGGEPLAVVGGVDKVVRGPCLEEALGVGDDLPGVELPRAGEGLEHRVLGGFADR